MRVCWCCVYNCSNSLLFSVLVHFCSCQCRCRISSLLCAYKCSNLHSILKFRTAFSRLSRSNNWVNSYYSWLYPESQRGKICLNLPLFKYSRQLLSVIALHAPLVRSNHQVTSSQCLDGSADVGGLSWFLSIFHAEELEPCSLSFDEVLSLPFLVVHELHSNVATLYAAVTPLCQIPCHRQGS